MDTEKQISSFRIRKIIILTIIYILLVLWAIFVLFPFFWMLLTSIRPLSDYSENPINLYTTSPTFENYVTAFTADNLLLYMSNTFIYAILSTFLMVVVAILAAFAFARLNFKGKNLVFTIFLAMMMIPNELVIITNYYTVVNLDLRNTFIALVMPSILSVFYIYLLRQNFMQVPDSMYMAAKVDGTSDFGYLTKILIPLSKPTIITITILKLIECWNSYVWPRLVSTKKDYYLVSNAIQEIRENGMGRENIPAMMAAVVCVSIPLIALFIIFRKQIMSGVAKTGTKG